jgi:hypothetical protein
MIRKNLKKVELPLDADYSRSQDLEEQNLSILKKIEQDKKVQKNQWKR